MGKFEEELERHRAAVEVQGFPPALYDATRFLLAVAHQPEAAERLCTYVHCDAGRTAALAQIAAAEKAGIARERERCAKIAEAQNAFGVAAEIRKTS